MAGFLWLGWVWQAWLVWARFCAVRTGMFWFGRHGEVSSCAVSQRGFGFGMAGMVSLGQARSGSVRYGRQGEARFRPSR